MWTAPSTERACPPETNNGPAGPLFRVAAGSSHLVVQLRALGLELRGLGLHLALDVDVHRVDALQVGGVVAYFLGDLHRAELRPAHRAEVRDLGRLLGQCLVVVATRGVR